MAELKELEEEFHQVKLQGKNERSNRIFFQTTNEDLTKEESENLNGLVQHIQQLQEHTSKVYGAKFLLNGQDTR